MRSRLKYAFGLYVLLGAAAAVTLDGELLWVVLLVFALLAFKNWVAVRREEQSAPASDDSLKTH